MDKSQAARFQSITTATQACCSGSRRSRYGAQPRLRSAIDTSAASASAGTVKLALMRPFGADSIKSGLEIVPVSRMDEVLARAMTRKPEPIEWDETTTTATAVPEEAPVEEEASTLTAH